MENNQSDKESSRQSAFKGSAVLLLCVLVVVFLVGVFPRWMRVLENNDLKGIATQTAPGIVTSVQINPGHSGGSGYFNAVTITFAGHQAFYTLPDTSRWNPQGGEKVIVIYRIGRNSGTPQVDSVTPLTTVRAHH